MIQVYPTTNEVTQPHEIPFETSEALIVVQAYTFFNKCPGGAGGDDGAVGT